MFEKDGMFFENEEEYLSELPDIKNKKIKRKKRASGCLFSLIIAVCFFGYFIYLFKHSYHIFTPGRINKMEDKFNIIVTDDIKLEEYNFIAGWQSPSRHELFISGIDDYDSFMKNNINGEITAKIQDGIRYDYEENKTYDYYDYYDKEYVICYIYEYTKQGYETEEYFNYARYASFYEESDGTYTARLANWFY